MGAVELEELVARVEDLPSLPLVVTRVFRLAEQPDSTAADFNAVISTDQALTSKVLRLANSAYYGFARRIGTVTEAVILLGINTICKLVFTAQASTLLQQEVAGYCLAGGELWRHSLTSAMAARLVARKVGFRHIEEAFVAGLLHDIGKLVLSQYVEQAYEVILDQVNQHRLSFMEAEQSVLGFDHARVGGLVATRWNLPEALVNAISFHHRPRRGQHPPPLEVFAHAGDALALMLGYGVGSDGLMYPINEEAMMDTGLTAEILEEIMVELSDSLADESPFLM